jgi:hypothetical protein
MEMLEAHVVAPLSFFFYHVLRTAILVLYLSVMLGMNLFFFADPSNMYSLDFFPLSLSLA